MTEPTNPSPEQPSQTPPSNPVPPPTGAGTSSATTATTPASFDQADIDQNKVMAILAYIIFLIPLLAAPKSPFAKYHTNQGLNLFLCMAIGVVALIILSVIGMVASAVIPPIAILFGALSCICYIALLVGGLVLAIMGIINAANGQAKKLPVVGNLFNLIK